MGQGASFRKWLNTPPKPDKDPMVIRGVEWDPSGSFKSCMFCDFAAQTREKNIVYEDDHVVAFGPLKKDAAKQHLLVIPRKHISTVGDLISSDVAMLDRMRAIAEDLLKCSPSNTQYSFHIPPWNSIDHLHLHAFEKPFGSWRESWRFSEGKPWCASFEKVKAWAASTEAEEEGQLPLAREDLAREEKT